MKSKLSVLAAGLVSSGCVINAADAWSSHLKIKSGRTLKEKTLEFDRETYIGLAIGHRLMYVGMEKGRYSPAHTSHYPAHGIFYDSLPAELYALGAPATACRPAGPILRTLRAFKLGSQNQFKIKLDAHISGKLVPDWMKNHLAQEGFIVNWIKGDMPYPDIEAELSWGANGSIDKIVITNDQLSRFPSRLYGWSHNLPIIFNRTGHPDVDRAIIAAMIKAQMYSMAVFSGIQLISTSPGDVCQLANSFLNLVKSADALILVVDLNGLAQLSDGIFSKTKSGGVHKAAIAKCLMNLWAQRRRSTFRRIFFVSKRKWIAIDESGHIHEKIICAEAHCPDADYTDIVSGLIFATESEFRASGKYYQVPEIIEKSNELFNNGSLKKLCF